MDYVITKKSMKSRKKLIPFPKNTLKEKTPVGFPEGVGYWIVSGKVCRTVAKPDGGIVFSVKSCVDEKEQVEVHFRLEDPCCQMAAGICEGSHVTVLMQEDYAADVKLGPYFGVVKWIFHKKGCGYEEVSVEA